MSLSFNVVIVDDDPQMIQIIQQRLECEEQFTCIRTYNSSEEAIQTLPQNQPDIVLMDINMPAKNGIECVSILKPQMVKTDFIMLTVYEDTKHIFDALAAGAVGYLLKRSVDRELIPALQECIKGGAPMDSFIARMVVQSFGKPKENPELEQLSERESEILKLMTKGHRYKEISDQLDISYHTVVSYIRRIYEKLHVNSRAEAIAKTTGRFDSASASPTIKE